MADNDLYDIAIVGGGINGVGIAATAAYHGLKVFLCEQHDLASGTSSASSKLIHGGLRYLELYEFELVRESIRDREILRHRAKHLVHPMNFIIPYSPLMRSKSLIRLGLFLYDHLYRSSSLPKSGALKLKHHPASRILADQIKSAFQYCDCVTNDARLVISNALAAKNYGATIVNYCKCELVEAIDGIWHLDLKHTNKKRSKIKAKLLVNATGPWADVFLKDMRLETDNSLTLVKGSHIVVPKFYDEDMAFLLQNNDKRVIFVVPWLTNFCLIGTTDVVFGQDPSDVKISDQEIDYLLHAVNSYLKRPLKREQIVHHFAGVRPLLRSQSSNPASITREYHIEQKIIAHAPLISIFGGKLTTYRSLAEKAVTKISQHFPELRAKSELLEPLPGGNFEDFDLLFEELSDAYPWLSPSLLNRYINLYGTLTKHVLGSATGEDQLGIDFGYNLFQSEVDYLLNHEWAKNADDILWRRTELGYYFPKENVLTLEKYIKKRIN